MGLINLRISELDEWASGRGAHPETPSPYGGDARGGTAGLGLVLGLPAGFTEHF